MIEEIKRLYEAHAREKNWKRWGPYLSERQWSTVREDYSVDGTSWTYFPHEHSRMRTYRWGEDGLLGITDRECRLCFANALWNGFDPIIKERLFGVIPTEGNHGEDVKECYYYLDSTPTHSYMKALYKYPQTQFPYQQLVEENQKRGIDQGEFELIDTKVFENNRYFDFFVEYAKNSPNDILIRISIANRSLQEAPLYFLPTLWFRNTWSWGIAREGFTDKLTLFLKDEGCIEAPHPTLGTFFLIYDKDPEGKFPTPLFTENESNNEKLFEVPNSTPFVKDAFHDYLIGGNKTAINPQNWGSKCALLYFLTFAPEEIKTLNFRLCAANESQNNYFGNEFDSVFEQRKKEADLFYTVKIPEYFDAPERNIARQAYAGLLWSKQFYHYVVKEWFDGDELQPSPPSERQFRRNKEWKHLYCNDIISIPDKWEYPWFAAWDLAFHMIPFAHIDPFFAKTQIILFLREWYMHPNGQQPAYEFEFSDVNPPVHAWAAWRVYKLTGRRGERDLAFLESAFQKLLLNFTWWVNRKDQKGNNLFSGGFLGLDNIGVFDRSKRDFNGSYLEQADGTAWMAMYCLTMLNISLELANSNPVYEDMASKFFEHFVFIADAINQFGGNGLWDEEDGFYYDRLRVGSKTVPIKIRSLVGLIPILAIENLEEAHIQKLKGFANRMKWFLKNRGDLANIIAYCKPSLHSGRRILAIPSRDRLVRVLHYLLDESEFLSPFGIRSLSKYHQEHPFVFKQGGTTQYVSYIPGESNSGYFGGNSNWRGPIWLPINFLIIEALERYGLFYGDELKVECPVGSGHKMSLKEVSKELSRRLTNLFLPSKDGIRPCMGDYKKYSQDPNWKDFILFNEYFHAETGQGLGASHQTGWTALIAKLLENI